MKKTALLVVGDEILSGRTHDANTVWLANELSNMGLPLAEVRVVPDEMDEIIAALNALRTKYDYVFTTGGIGPTHDDITVDAVAAAFGVELPIHPEALAMMEERYKDRGGMNDARKRMARVPVGAAMIDNTLTIAPGIHMDNVFVMAGVPSIMQVMFNALKPRLQGGTPILSRTLRCAIPEGSIAAPLEETSKKYPALKFGSYPSKTLDKSSWNVSLVVKGTDVALLDKAFAEMCDFVRAQGEEPEVLS